MRLMGTPLVIDNGLYVSLAARLSQDQPVAYFSSWNNAFPTSREFAPGTGIKNVERVDDPIRFMLEGKASRVIIPDLYLPGFEVLSGELEIPFYGSGASSQLETDRSFMLEFLEEHGLAIIDSVEIDGISALEDYLRDKKDKFVKVSVFRGDMETEPWTDWQDKQLWLNHLKVRLGPIGDRMRFIVQDRLDSEAEVGIDTFFDNGWATPMILGVENKDAGYAGVLIDDFPKPLMPLMSALGEYLGEHRYANFFSNEVRLTKDGEVYMTDATCRIPSPPGGVMMAACRNLSDVILNGENPDYGNARCFYEIVLKSQQCCKDYLAVSFPKAMAERYAFHNYCVIDGKTWIVPHDSGYEEFGSALGWGKDPDSAKAMALEAAEAIKGDGIRFDDGVLEKADKELAKGAKLGLL